MISEVAVAGSGCAVPITGVDVAWFDREVAVGSGSIILNGVVVGASAAGGTAGRVGMLLLGTRVGVRVAAIAVAVARSAAITCGTFSGTAAMSSNRSHGP
jgi:hypothetical protein